MTDLGLILLAIGLFHLFRFILRIGALRLKLTVETDLLTAISAFLTYFALPVVATLL